MKPRNFTSGLAFDHRLWRQVSASLFSEVPASGRAPRVSVVIPAYNQSAFLEEALRSVLDQTEQDFEIIVVDDESTDDTPAVVMAVSRSLPEPGPIRYFWQANQGLAGARNTGILQARGEWVALLDSDDAWRPDYLEKMLALAGQNPQANVFYCAVSYVDAGGRSLPQHPGAQVIPAGELYWTLLRSNFLVPSTILMRRETVLRAGLFDPAFRRLQDWELWLRLLGQGISFAGLPERLVRYRIHPASLSTDPAGGQRAALAMARKLFGKDSGRVQDWSAEKKRVFGGVYRYHALSAVIQGKEDWLSAASFLRRAFEIDPSLTGDLDLFYELVLGSQPVGYRGTGAGLTLVENAANLQAALQSAFHPPAPSGLADRRSQALSSGWWAAGLAAYNQGWTHLSRRYFWQAIRRYPARLRSPQAAAYLVKSWLGPARLSRLRQARRRLQPEGFRPASARTGELHGRIED